MLVARSAREQNRCFSQSHPLFVSQQSQFQAEMVRAGLLAQSALFLSGVFAQRTVVDTGYTRYKGQSLPNGIVQWLGMRYAAPPVGPLRFSAPQDPEEADEIQDAFQVCCNSHTVLSVTCRPFINYLCIAWSAVHPD